MLIYSTMDIPMGLASVIATEAIFHTDEYSAHRPDRFMFQHYNKQIYYIQEVLMEVNGLSGISMDKGPQTLMVSTLPGSKQGSQDTGSGVISLPPIGRPVRCFSTKALSVFNSLIGGV